VSEYVTPEEQQQWQCGKCGIPLEISPVRVAYLGSGFPVDLLKCPQCGAVYIPENLALGKMADVEKALEDK
jgi:ribosomal protein S27AE